jgi:hypothetical protein
MQGTSKTDMVLRKFLEKENDNPKTYMLHRESVSINKGIHAKIFK